MTHTNVLNRKLEEVYGVGKEFTTVAALWGVRPSRPSGRCPASELKSLMRDPARASAR